MKETPKSIYEWALAYAKHKWSVIPVGRDKKPLIDWKKYQTERATDDQIKKWFDVHDPPNVGVVTGKISNLTVVDVEKDGKWDDLPVTMTAKTGGGGYHLFYKYAEGVQNAVRIRTLTDIRGEGGYVVAAPSKHASGNHYEWTRQENEQQFPFQFFNVKPKENNWQKLLEGVGNGERNEGASKVIGKFLNSVRPQEWQTTAWEMAVLWNQRNSPPLNERELRSVFNSILGRQMRKPIETSEDDGDIKLISEIARGLTDDMTVSYSTGYEPYDKAFMGGLKEGDLVFLSGYTGMGKTLFGQSITYNLEKNGHPCLWFEFEVPVGELWRKFKDMGMDDTSQVYGPEKNVIKRLDWIQEKIIDARDRFKTKVVFIDHLGFLTEEPKNYDPNITNNMAMVMTFICRKLKTIAIQEKIAVVLMGHLRKPVGHSGGDPTFHDIKDSSGVAQEADSVIIINRKKKKDRHEDAEDDIYENKTFVKIEKNRRTGQNKSFMVSMSNGRLVDAKDDLKEFASEVIKDANW